MDSAEYTTPESYTAARLRQLNLLRVTGYGAFLANALMGTFESYWLKQLGFNNEFIGTYYMVFSAVSLAANLLWGWLADHGGKPARLTRIGCWTFGLVSLVYPFAQAGWVFLVYAALKGLFATMAFSMLPLLVASVAAPGEEGKTYGQFRIFGTYGFLTASVLLPWLLKDVHWSAAGIELGSIQIMFVIASLATVMAGIPLRWYCAPVYRGSPAADPAAAPLPSTVPAVAAPSASRPVAVRGLRAVLAKPEMVGYLVAYFFFALANPAVFFYLYVYASDLGADPQFVGLLSCCLGIVGLTCLRVMGWITDRTKPRYIIWIAFAAQPLRALAAAWVQGNYLWLVLPQIFHIFTWAGPEVARIYFITRLVGAENRGKAMGLVMSVEVLAGIVGAPMCGWLSTHFGYSTMYLSAAGVSTIGFVIFSGCLWWMARRQSAVPGEDAAALALNDGGGSTENACQPAG